MGDHTAFFYGTLMAPAVLHRVIHGTSTPASYQTAAYTHLPALLPSFQRHKVRSADYPAILPANSTACVRGTLVSGLTDADIWRLDIFEGNEYARRKVKVRLLRGEEVEDVGKVLTDAELEAVKGEEVEVEAYVWVAGKQRLEAREWDFGEFVREKMGRWVGREAEREYAEVDDAVAAKNNKDPTGGRGVNGDITKVLKENNGKAKELVESAV